MNKTSRSLTFGLPLDRSRVIHPFSASEAFLIPRYQNLGSLTEEFRGGFGLWGGIQRMSLPPQARAGLSPGSAFGFLMGYGECQPYRDSKVELNAGVSDDWGVPTLRIDVRWHENEQRMGERIEKDLHAMVEAAGGSVVVVSGTSGPVGQLFVDRVVRAAAAPGAFVHEVGGARMGASPRDSVVNEYCQLWDSKNVFVTDGACWPASGWQNPTLTMMAITARSCSFLADSLARGDL